MYYFLKVTRSSSFYFFIANLFHTLNNMFYLRFQQLVIKRQALVLIVDVDIFTTIRLFYIVLLDTMYSKEISMTQAMNVFPVISERRYSSNSKQSFINSMCAFASNNSRTSKQHETISTIIIIKIIPVSDKPLSLLIV